MKIKQVHGPQMTLNRGAIDHPKTILDHKTMFRIKTRTNTVVPSELDFEILF